MRREGVAKAREEMAVKEPEKSAYELLRDEKIKANAAKLEELGLGKATLLPEPKAKRAKRKRPEASESAPPRRSSRLRQEAAPTRTFPMTICPRSRSGPPFPGIA